MAGVGWVLARLFIVAFTRLEDIPVSVLLQFVSTFAVWIIADRLKLSAIITMVVYAMTIAQRVGGRMNARYRIASYAVWDVAVLVLNVLAFVLIGLQLRGIVSRVQGPPDLRALRGGGVPDGDCRPHRLGHDLRGVAGAEEAATATDAGQATADGGERDPGLVVWDAPGDRHTGRGAGAAGGVTGLPAPGPDRLLGILRGADDAGGAGAHAPAAAAPPLSGRGPDGGARGGHRAGRDVAGGAAGAGAAG